MHAILEKLPFKEFFHVSWILNILVIIFGIIIQGRLPPEIPLFYGLPQGEAQIFSSWGILIPSVSSLIFIIINLLLSTTIKDDFIKKTLILAGFGAAIFASITSLKIIFLVGYI